MDFPSMVQRAGDKLIVRSVVSGNQLYADQGSTSGRIAQNQNQQQQSDLANSSTNAQNNNNNNSNNRHIMQDMLNNSNVLEQELKRYAQEQFRQQQQNLAVAVAQQHQQQHQQQQQQHIKPPQQTHTSDMSTDHSTVLELKERLLPQCKIKRNYSCNYCTYFTQNPRVHLMHLRDVHGEKIVINKCKLCLYASRHFQKLVRHMKMVHGCTDGISGGHGQSRGKRGMSREMRKRKLEQSVGLDDDVVEVASPRSSVSGVADLTTLEQFKRELELQEQKLQREKKAFNKQQEEQLQQQQLAVGAVLAAAYNHQREQAKASLEHDATDSSTPNTATTSSTTNRHDASSSTHSGSASPSEVISPTFSNSANNDERPHCRLLKCSLCDFTTLYPTQLHDHEIVKHDKTKFFRCEKCSYVTHIKARFSKHVKYHSMPMIKCVTCDFRTPYKWNLDRHMKNHGGTGPFKCAACDFTADIKQSLTVHEMNHHVPPVGHAAGMALMGRRRVNKVGATDISDDFLSDSADLDEQYTNNNLDDDDDGMVLAETVSPFKKFKYDDEPTDLSQKGASSDSSSNTSKHLNILNLSTEKGMQKSIADVFSIELMQPQFAKLFTPELLKMIPSSALNLSKEMPASSLSDIASMFFTEKQISEMSQMLQKQEAAAAQLSPTPTIASTTSQNSRSILQKKTAAPGSFFDKLKSSALTTGGPNENLICPCGHVAKCLSESIIHRKTCKFNAIAEDDIDEEQDDLDGRLEIDFTEDDDKQSHSALNLSVSGSTRCQHCRHRCKTSSDLLNHLKICQDAGRFGDSYDSMSGESNTGRSHAENNHETTQQQHPMENRVFVWNNMPRSQNNTLNDIKAITTKSLQTTLQNNISTTTEDNRYYGVETAPGYGEVTKKMNPEEETANSSLKKVYKCPHCSFWASTASRFHVHIVGHLNKKPFECSLCSYRSNWRWDITKHIRLKTIRDPSHKNARVLMNDETGRRNYTKYNKYITLMKVTEEDGDPKLMKSGEMTPNQVASLSFFNDFNKNLANHEPANSIVAHLNGLKEDITLEPVPKNQTQTADEFMPLPLLASMMNVAFSQQQNKDDLSPATLITPSVTISAVRRNNAPPVSKLCDDLLTDYKEEGSERRTYYRCRKCSYRHSNRDAALAHVKIHYLDGNYPTPIITATATNNQQQQQQQQQITSPLEVAINSNPYMNKMLAALCLPQTNNNKQHSMLSSVGLLQQAIQGNTLPLTLNKCGTVASSDTASILEHGEQKATQNEASATADLNQTHTTATTITTTTNVDCLLKQQQQKQTQTFENKSLQHLLTAPKQKLQSQKQTQLEQQLKSKHHITGWGDETHADCVDDDDDDNDNDTHYIDGDGGVGVNDYKINKSLVLGTTTTTATATATTNASDQIVTTFAYNNNDNSNKKLLEMVSSNSSTTILNNNNVTSANNNQLNVKLTDIDIEIVDEQQHKNQENEQNSSKLIAFNNGGVDHDVNCVGLVNGASSLHNLSNSSYSSAESAAASPSSSLASCYTSSSRSFSASSTPSPTSSTSYMHKLRLANNDNNNCVTAVETTATTAAATTTTTATIATTENEACASILSSSTTNLNHNIFNSNSTTTSTTTISTTTTTTTTSTSTQVNAHNNQNSALIVNDCDPRRNLVPPYRCGHCHQVSNWKHVIQRHCRLKHSGDIYIESLDRNTVMDAKPIYRLHHPNMSNQRDNSMNFDVAVKTLQHQQQPPTQISTYNKNNNNTINNNKSNENNNVLINNKKNELLLQTHAQAAAAANAANTTQDLQAAAAVYFAAVSRTLNAGGAAAANLMGVGEELLQQQLQQNDQIDITRLSNTNNNNNNINNLASTSNLAQLLEAANNNSQQQQQQQQQQLNSKCKQQKCPMCPYISESKSQMNYHVSLHKPTQYECNLCTFVCAKKQHLSSHMRTVHQQALINNTSNNNNNNSNKSNANINLDLNSALQFVSAISQQQDANSLVIDLTALKKVFTVAQQQQQQQQASQQKLSPTTTTTASLPPEYQFKQILYCGKCPARFAQRYNESQRAKEELMEHLDWHNSSNPLANYCCEYCDYRALHDTLIQTHRFVHTQQYQDKYNEIYKNCKHDLQFAAPRLRLIPMLLDAPINALKDVSQLVWVVDDKQELTQQQEEAVGSSTSNAAAYDNSNSLLKKQLESGVCGAITNESSLEELAEETAAEAQANEDQLAQMQCSSGSGSTTDAAAADNCSVSQAETAAASERCQHCPYETADMEQYKEHIQHHICVAQKTLAYTCEHCDYTHDEEKLIEQHTQVHFNMMQRLKGVTFFTSYDNLELVVEPPHDADANDDDDAASSKVDVDVDEKESSQRQKSKRTAGIAVKSDKFLMQSNKTSKNNNSSSSSGSATPEHNNNNEEDAVNENTVKAQETEDKNATMRKPKLLITFKDKEITDKAEQQPQNKQRDTNIVERLRSRSTRVVGFGETPETQTSAKTILVNAKTGQVISRN